MTATEEQSQRAVNVETTVDGRDGEGIGERVGAVPGLRRDVGETALLVDDDRPPWAVDGATE